jgi:hypothetical protein
VRSTQREAPVEINPWLALCILQQVFNFIFDCKRWEFCVLTFFIKLKLLANQLCHLFSCFYTYFFRNGQYLISPQKAAKK